jgi:hypothetical protein
VSLDLGGTADDLAVQRVLHAVFDLDDDGLVHLVARDVAATRLAVTAGVASLTSWADDFVTGGGLLCLSLYFASSTISVSASGASTASDFLGADFFAGLRRRLVDHGGSHGCRAHARG